MFNKCLSHASDNKEPMPEEQINSHGLLVCIAKSCCLLTVFEGTPEVAADIMDVDHKLSN